MNYIDIILVILLLLAAISGYRKGFIVELASLAALILGIWGAFEFSDITSTFLIEYFNLHWEHLRIISLIITFVVIVILVNIVGNVVNKMVEAILLGFLNRLAGLVFGVLKSILILSVLLVVFDRIDRDVNLISDEKKEDSKLYKPIRSFAPNIFPFIEEWVNDIAVDEGKEDSQGNAI